ncbi:MAG: HAD family hydrolase [Anaerolineae bacterium]
MMLAGADTVKRLRHCPGRRPLGIIDAGTLTKLPEVMMPLPYQAVVFDFDYTLVDSSRGVVTCFNRALAELGMAQAPAEAICRTIGLPLRQCFVEVAGEGERGRTQEFLEAFRVQADELMNPLTELQPAARVALTALHDCGLRMGIVSLKFRYRIRAYLESEGLLGLFDTIVGSEDVSAPKPDPLGLFEVLRRLEVPPERALYVGDNVVDAETAQRAGVDFVAVLTGTTPSEAFAAYPSRAVLPDLTGLPAVAGCSREA